MFFSESTDDVFIIPDPAPPASRFPLKSQAQGIPEPAVRASNSGPTLLQEQALATMNFGGYTDAHKHHASALKYEQTRAYVTKQTTLQVHDRIGMEICLKYKVEGNLLPKLLGVSYNFISPLYGQRFLSAVVLP